MTIFELIKRLEELGAKHGNLDVEISSTEARTPDHIRCAMVMLTRTSKIVLLSGDERDWRYGMDLPAQPKL